MLREVCEIEGLRAENRALSTLVGVARGDLRGCLNTLQASWSIEKGCPIKLIIFLFLLCGEAVYKLEE
jgi:DNA polymerase III delta prime subunit